MKLGGGMLLMAATIVLGVANCAVAGSIALVKDGQPAVHIVVPDEMNPVEKWAAEDLALYLSNMARAVRPQTYLDKSGQMNKVYFDLYSG